MLPLHKQIARKLVFPAMLGLGAERWFFRASSLGYLILCYHGVYHRSSMPFNGRHIRTSVFEKHLRYFRRHFDILSLDDVFVRVEEGRFAQRPTLALSFDDGYRNNLTYALPLLARYEVPATLFAITGILDGTQSRIWTDTLDMIRVKLAGQSLQWEDQIFADKGGQLYNEAGQSIYDYFQTYACGERDNRLARLAKQQQLQAWVMDQQIDFHRLLSPEELRQIDGSPWVSVQAHTYRHHDLAFREAAEIRLELLQGKSALENLLQHPVETLAFPFGRYDQRTKAIAREVGYRQLLALRYQHEEDRNEQDLLPRLNVSGTTTFDSQIVHLRRKWRQLGI
ncbi:MAG: polysaccharide deacetylase family protein [Bacteroidota bacterium]